MAIYRVTVRGQFDELDDDIQQALREHAEAHDHLHARFTPDGTFTYDLAMGAFSFRYEIRVTAESRVESDAEALAQGTERARAELDALSITHKRLRATATNMADMWAPDQADATSIRPHASGA